MSPPNGDHSQYHEFKSILGCSAAINFSVWQSWLLSARKIPMSGMNHGSVFKNCRNLRNNHCNPNSRSWQIQIMHTQDHNQKSIHNHKPVVEEVQLLEVKKEDGSLSPFPVVACRNIFILPGVPHLLHRKWQVIAVLLHFGSYIKGIGW